jgi:hypothetical protein
MGTADHPLPINLWAVYCKENLTLISHVRICSKITYLNIVLVSFGRHAALFSVQIGSDQLSEDTVNTEYYFTCDVHVLV